MTAPDNSADPPPQGPTEAFATENARLRQLNTAPPVHSGETHHDLAESVWISLDPTPGVFLSFEPVADGFRLEMPNAGRSRWISLSFALSHEVLAQGWFLGLRTDTETAGFLSFRLCLRYVLQDGSFRDVFCPDYTISSGGRRDQISYVEIDPALATLCASAECHLFFQGAEFDVTFREIDLLLMR